MEPHMSALTLLARKDRVAKQTILDKVLVEALKRMSAAKPKAA